MSDTNKGRTQDHGHQDEHSSHQKKMYLRFGAMILTEMVVMYGLKFVSSWEWSHVRLSESRMTMALSVGGAMGLVLFAWMNMYKNTKANVAVVVISVLLLGTGVVLDRSQITVQDTAYMKSMIPHHSMAITRSERANFDDVQVCELAVAISEAQRREVAEMDWLIEDINSNRAATTAEEAEARPVPEYHDAADFECPTD